MFRSRTATLATVVGVSALSMLAFAGAASAHVTASSADAKQGGYAVVTFRVPNEETNANTTKLQVQLPTDTPLAFAATQPVAGWTATATKTKLAKPIKTEDGELTEAVTQLTWTATGSAAIKPGEFQQFDVQMGPLPDQADVTFPAIQTYSNGEVVKWIERQAPGSSQEPDHPAPVLSLTAAGTTSNPLQSPLTYGATPLNFQSKSESSSNTGPVVLSIIALVVAVGALGLAVVSRARRSS